MQVGQVSDDLFGAGLAVLTPPVLRDPLAVDLVFGNDGDRGVEQLQATLDGGHSDTDAIIGSGEIGPAGKLPRLYPVAGQHLVHHFTPPRRFGNEQAATVVVIDPGSQRSGRLLGLRLQVELDRRLAGIVGIRIRIAVYRGPDVVEGSERLFDGIRGQEQGFGWQ